MSFPFSDAADPPWLAERRKRFMRPDAARWLRADFERFLPPGMKANFDPVQPRDDEGRWTDTGGSNPLLRPVAAGLLPKIPGIRPPTSGERTRLYTAIANRVRENGTALADVIASSSWLYQAYPLINSYLDQPKSLAELQADVLVSKAGYDVHHIVERSSALDDGYPQRRADDADNLARIPRMKHWDINRWYQAENIRFDGMTPRDYLRGKDWDERRRIGLEALRLFGVLTP